MQKVDWVRFCRLCVFTKKYFKKGVRVAEVNILFIDCHFFLVVIAL